MDPAPQRVQQPHVALQKTALPRVVTDCLFGNANEAGRKLTLFVSGFSALEMMTSQEGVNKQWCASNTNSAVKVIPVSVDKVSPLDPFGSQL